MQLRNTHIWDLAFILLLIVFAVLKLQHASTPYFWDELGVYVPGALKMKDMGTIGLLPSALEPLYSRGHPLLFVCTQAAAFDFFGDTPFSGHCFSLFLALATLAALYLTTANLFNKATALISCLLLAVQPVFYAMAGMILPEMMLTLFTVPTLWAIIRQKWLIYAIFGSLAMMTKESAIIIPPLALLIAFADGMKAGAPFSARWLRAYGWCLFPLLVYAAFLLVQKTQNGWYFFPEHMGYLRSIPDFIEHIWYHFRDVAFGHGRWVLTAFMLFALVHAIRLKTENSRTIIISALFILCSILFAALNFYLLRYMLYAFPFMVVMAVAGIYTLASRLKSLAGQALTAAFTAASTLLSLYYMDTGKFNDSADMSYLHLVNCEKEAIAWAEQQTWRDSVIEANFPMFQGMADKRYGYLIGQPFNTSTNFEKPARYGLLFHMDGQPVPVWNGKPYEVIREFRNHYARITAVRFH